MADRRIFTYEEAAALLPEVRELTAASVEEVRTLAGTDELAEVSDAHLTQVEQIVQSWAASILDLGIEVKGLWLIDFDSGSGYYCWKYPEEALEYFHGYEEGFSGRVKLN